MKTPNNSRGRKVIQIAYNPKLYSIAGEGLKKIKGDDEKWN